MRAARRIFIPGWIAATGLVMGAAVAAAQPYGPGVIDPRASSAAFPSGPGGSQYGADIWLEGEPSYFRLGDRLNVRFSVPRDSYIAIVHIDSDGELDFLYPASPWDDGFVRGGRSQSLPIRSFASTTIRARPGIGYLYLIASPYPLDFRYFHGGIGSAWDWGYAGRNVYGDPFLAFDQVTRLILPGWPYVDYAWDYHSYYVDGIHRYPTYACSNQYRTWGWGWSPSFGSCSRLDVFVRNNPYYYDTRRYRGDRRVYLREYDRLDPRYGFKEAPDDPFGRLPSRAPAPPVRDAAPGPTGRDEVPRRDPVTAPAPTQPTRPGQTAPAPRPSVPTRDPVAEPRTAEPARGVTVPTRSAIPTGSGTATRPPPAEGRPAAAPQSEGSTQRPSSSPTSRGTEPATRSPASGSPQNEPARRPTP